MLGNKLVTNVPNLYTFHMLYYLQRYINFDF